MSITLCKVGSVYRDSGAAPRQLVNVYIYSERAPTSTSFLHTVYINMHIKAPAYAVNGHNYVWNWAMLMTFCWVYYISQIQFRDCIVTVHMATWQMRRIDNSYLYVGVVKPHNYVTSVNISLGSSTLSH